MNEGRKVVFCPMMEDEYFDDIQVEGSELYFYHKQTGCCVFAMLDAFSLAFVGTIEMG